MIDFNSCLHQLEIQDLRYHGEKYTWSNKRPDNPIAKKLDRALINEHWLNSYPCSLAVFHAPDISDHTPCCIEPIRPLPQAGTKPFKFFNYLTLHPDFLKLVAETWVCTESENHSLSQLSVKQKELKSVLKTLNKEKFSDKQKRVSDTNCLFMDAQVLSLRQPTSDNFAAEKALLEKLQFLKKIEEEYFKQLSRINWLRCGDQNTSYFHKVATARKAFNSIIILISVTGIEATSPEDIGNLAVAHFLNILGPPTPKTTPLMISSVADMIRTDRFSCSQAQAALLSRLPTPEDITKTLFKLNKNKSPGPDGFTSGFYTAAWDILGQEVINSISSFFKTSILPTSTNSTILTLLPKFPGATIIKDYRPISCCNTLYKVISKILVNRLKPLLPSIILPNQTAFIKGRLLLENCLLASELVSGYHKQQVEKKLTLKLDIAKAFDSVRWDFLIACLLSLNLPQDYIQRLAACFTSPSFSVGINGRLHGFFKGTRGLRQGDPLSPYLFGLVMNILSHKLNEAAQSGRFGFHPRCQESGLTHLCFADDILVFTDGSLNSVQMILQVLDEFKAFSGLSISVEKSCFFSSGLSEVEIDAITETCGIPAGTFPIRYLGLPLNTRKLSIANCEPLLHQIKSKIKSWTSKYLSFAGRQVLISTVIGGITNFWSGAFILPKECISLIDKMCNAFLWKGTLEGKYVARVAWEKVATPRKNGGLGLRNLAIWNRTCIIKLLWLLLFRPESV